MQRIHNLSGAGKRSQAAGAQNDMGRNLDAPIPPADLALVAKPSCELLWLAVIERAFLDAQRMSRDRKWCFEALEFLSKPSDGLEMVCAAARVDSEIITDRAKRLRKTFLEMEGERLTKPS